MAAELAESDFVCSKLEEDEADDCDVPEEEPSEDDEEVAECKGRTRATCIALIYCKRQSHARKCAQRHKQNHQCSLAKA